MDSTQNFRWAIALGSNLGDRVETLRGARRDLGTLGRVLAASSLFESAPMYELDQPAFLNAVVVLESALGAHELLTELQALERAAGRARDAQRRYGPRSLDLDIVAGRAGMGEGVVVDRPTLQVPHPRLHERGFVVVPLFEVCSDWVDPRTDTPIQVLYDALVDTAGLVPILRCEEWK